MKILIRTSYSYLYNYSFLAFGVQRHSSASSVTTIIIDYKLQKHQIFLYYRHSIWANVLGLLIGVIKC